MKKNLGNVDRILRIAFAVVVAILFFTKVISGLSGIILLVVAGVLALTSFVSFCPIYWALGWKSTEKE
ncbi:MAG: DUF2892 domain-containing protein [Bacteroidales bacterium]|nr:DUF2892 domain-containing protein [Bacteroidales bacterium]